MSDRVERYSWDEKVFKQLKDMQKKKEYVGVGTHDIGTIISVDKVTNKHGDSEIEVIYQIND